MLTEVTYAPLFIRKILPSLIPLQNFTPYYDPNVAYGFMI